MNSNYYLLFLAPEVICKYISSGQTRVTLHYPAPHVQVDDRILLVRTSGEKTILPFVYQIASVNRNAGTITMQIEDMYNRAIRSAETTHLPALRNICSQVYPDPFPLGEETFKQVVDALG